ncbi:hypothetical protein Pint_17260 [Pistacia integerrima]|uniref:Uncharacterized protein n=1 Tax=Pistacia integerrima TaxID=434235 RepID=A0ACC0Z0F2_9ROSI|nr:hypothetical protein Pint_17260 [Pistacia integerrima]
MMTGIVDETFATTNFKDGKPNICLWQTPFYDIKNLNYLPVSHNDFVKLQLPVTSPTQSPTLPGSKLEVDWGPLPTFDDLKKFMNENPWKLKESWALIKNISAETILLEKLSKPGERTKRNLNVNHAPVKKPDASVFVTEKGNIVGGGTNAILNALAAYLRYLEGTARDDWQESWCMKGYVMQKVGMELHFLPSLAQPFVLVSYREGRVHYEAIKYEKERNAGFLSPFGYSAVTVAAAADAVCSMEWYWLMSLRSLISEGGIYSTLDMEMEWLSNTGGNRVWAVTVLGFGKSEKPNIVYTELMWAELLRDFVVEVVGEPVHLIGNSIGGYFVAIVACLWHALVKSVVLINSAGDVVPKHSFTQFSNRTERVDDWLIGEMLRASHDPGVLVVLESIFSFNLSLPLSYLLEGFNEKVLIIQGMKDPISDSKSKLDMLREHCPGFAIRELDAGHCPHDERPEEVNSLICKWIEAIKVSYQLRAYYPVLVYRKGSNYGTGGVKLSPK